MAHPSGTKESKGIPDMPSHLHVPTTATGPGGLCCPYCGTGNPKWCKEPLHGSDTGYAQYSSYDSTISPSWEQRVPEMPSYWQAPRTIPGKPLSYLAAGLWHLLCISSVFKPDLNEHWIAKCREKEWDKQVDRTVNRLTNSSTAAGLILATTAVFVSTAPPTNTWNYSQPTVTCLSFLALSHALMSIWFGTFVIIVYQVMTPRWAVQVLMVNRWRVCCTLVVMSLPVINLLLAMFTLILAISVATLTSPLRSLRVSAVVEGAIWILFGMLAFINLVNAEFWTCHLPRFITGIAIPWSWKHPHRKANAEDQGQSSRVEAV